MLTSILVATVFACSSASDTTTSTTTPAAVVAPTTPTAVAPTTPTNGLTVDKLKAAQGLVHAMQPWSDAEPKLKAEIGAPMKVEGDVNKWWAQDGANCQILTIQMMADSVGQIDLASGACPAS